MALLNLVKCPMCAKSIDEEALICPYCRSEIPQHKRDEVAAARTRSEQIANAIMQGIAAAVGLFVLYAVASAIWTS